MSKRLFLTVLFLPLVLAPVHAQETAGLSLSAGVWDYDTDEDIRSGSGVFVGDSDVRLDDADDAFYELTLRPGGDFVPALSLRYMNVEIDGQAETSGTGLPLPIGGGFSTQQDINTDIDDLELASYYSYRLPAGFGLDLGAAVKRLDGEIVARDAGSGQQVDRREIDIIFPLLLGAVRYQPWGWLNARISARGISARGDSVSEYRAQVGVSPWSWLTVSGGYWRKHYDVEDSDLDLDLTLKGPFVTVSAGF